MHRGTARNSRDGEGSDMAVIAIGVAVLAIGMIAVRNGAVSDIEEAWFRAANDLPGWLYPVVWPFQQLGALVLGPVVAIVALVLGKHRLAVAAVAVTVLKLASERAVKAIVSRQRPGTSIGPDVELRGDVHLAGESFVSGHAVLVAGLAGVVTPYVPGRWKVVPWVLVGAVMVGRIYVGAHNPLDVICGAALGVAIAGVVNLVIGRRHPVGSRDQRPDRAGGEHGEPTRATGTARGRALPVVLAFAALPACGDDGEQGTSRSELADDVITVGSFDFRESIVVAEVYSQALEGAGFRVRRAFDLGPREFVGPALEAGLVELLPEYAGTAAEFHSLGTAEPTDDVAFTHRELQRAISGLPVVALEAAPAQDANTFVVTAATAQRLGVTALSELAAEAGELTFGGPAECASRRLCLVGLDDVYGLQFGEFVALDAGGALTHQALLQGDVDVALLFSTDPLIAARDLVELVDDRGLQPAENITPLLRTEIVDRWGDGVVTVIDGASAELTTSAVRTLNEAAGTPDADVGSVVAAWWSEVSS